MVKYKITFKFDIEKSLEYSNVYDEKIEIEELNDTCFDSVFNTDEKIKEFEEWYNNGLDDDKISVNDIIYNKEGEDIGVLEVSLNSELKEPKIFANEIIDYLFEGECPTVNYHVVGTTSEDYWDYRKDAPEQRSRKVEYDDSADVNSYSNVTITKE